MSVRTNPPATGTKQVKQSLGLSCRASFEALASVYASAGACHTGRHDDSYIMNCISHCLDIDRVIEVVIHRAQLAGVFASLFVLAHNIPANTVRDESTFFARMVQSSHK